MSTRTFKVHTESLGRLIACIQKAMYGVTNSAFTKEMPGELHRAAIGDRVFISEKEVSDNALFGPFYIAGERRSIVCKSKRGVWVEIDSKRTPPSEIAYWVEFENRCWCLLFDKTLSDRISIVWPYNWQDLNIELPPWGLVREDDASQLMSFARKNEIEAQEFLRRHKVW